LKVNVENAPKMVGQLARQLEIEALVERMDPVLARLKKDKRAFLASLTNLENQPNQAKLAKRLQSELVEMKAAIESHPEFSKVGQWSEFTALTAGEILAWEQRLSAAIRRGKLRYVAGQVIPGADRNTMRAATAKSKDEAREMLDQALSAYKQCQAYVDEVVREEPELKRFRVSHGGHKRTASWLKNTCLKKQKTTERLIRGLEKRFKKRPVKKARPVKKPKKKKRKTKKKSKTKTRKKKAPVKKTPEEDPNKKKRRIDRWD
jgi:hypothetical protein